MPQPLRKNDYYGYSANTPYRREYSPYYAPNARPYPLPQKRQVQKTAPKTRARKKQNPLLALIRAAISLSFFAALVYYVMPYNYTNYVEPMIINRFFNRNLTLDAKACAYPTLNYLANADLNGERVFVPVRHEDTAQMAPLTPSSRMHGLENDLRILSEKYPKLTPSIYVWDFTRSRSAELNAVQVYPSASIIKLPILTELFRMSESLKASGYSPVDLHKKILLDNIHKTEGSGTLQYRKDEYHTLDYLLGEMIRSSDNSATNLVLDEIGGMNALNAAARKWGLSSTQMTHWLPDLGGTNTISAKDMATLLYNIDNPKFLNEHSRYKIKEYMTNVHNRSLLQAGLPKEAELLHKTGDIGTMLGDAGIVYAPNGKKYIAVVLVKRPFNDYSARDFIQQASKIIYKAIAKNSEFYY